MDDQSGSYRSAPLPYPGATHDSNLLDDRSIDLFGFFVILMDAMFMFSMKSIDFYVTFAMAQFTLDLDDCVVCHCLISAKFIGCCLVLLYGVLCDSYIGRYNSTAILNASLIALPLLYFCLSYPYLIMSTSVKVGMFKLSLAFLALSFLIEPVRMVMVVTAVNRKYIKNPRLLFSVLVTAWNFAVAMAGLEIYLCLDSRIALTIAMIFNCLAITFYCIFLVIFRDFFNEGRHDVAIVEKAAANCCCFLVKKLDQKLFKYKFFSKSGWKNFCCITFSSATIMNGKALLGFLMVILPLTLTLSLQVSLDVAYFIQLATLYFTSEQFPMVAIRAFSFVVLFPLFEYSCHRYFTNFSNAELMRDFVFIGVGAVFINLAIIWSSILQQMVSRSEGFWTISDQNKQLSLINCLTETVFIRGDYLNLLRTLKPNEWIPLDPMRPLHVVNIADEYSIFEITVMNDNLALYDDHNISIPQDSFNWIVILPWEIFKIPPSVFFPREIFSVDPTLYEPAKVCILCALPVCVGWLSLITMGGEIRENLDLSHSKVLRLVGSYNISFEYGANINVTYKHQEANFLHLSSYLLIIHGKMRSDNDSRNAQVSSNETYDSYKELANNVEVGITVLTLRQQRNYGTTWICPMVIFNIFGDIFFQVSILSCTYNMSPPHLRATTFCCIVALQFPSYLFFFLKTPLGYQALNPILIFSGACANCFFLILYLFATLFYAHQWDTLSVGSMHESSNSLKPVIPSFDESPPDDPLT